MKARIKYSTLTRWCSPEEQADAGDRKQELTKRVEQVRALQLPPHYLRVRVSGVICLPTAVNLPDERIIRDVLDKCNIPGTAVTTDSWGLTDSARFI